MAGIPNYADAWTGGARQQPANDHVWAADLDRLRFSDPAICAAALHRPDTMLKYDTRDATRRRIVRRAAAIDQD